MTQRVMMAMKAAHVFIKRKLFSARVWLADLLLGRAAVLMNLRVNEVLTLRPARDGVDRFVISGCVVVGPGRINVEVGRSG